MAQSGSSVALVEVICNLGPKHIVTALVVSCSLCLYIDTNRLPVTFYTLRSILLPCLVCQSKLATWHCQYAQVS